ncbi:MAG: hypothetical protein KGY66_03905 [Candidatus Thermoplasmatota archaeon]|nr:hypothetical protein [Candidatus Thermoplasmatota archaeon]MBS3790042.1 hypothetical protein [Candidatus Thermoplasmatota archaeon]
MDKPMDTELIEEIWNESPKSVKELEDLSLHSILLVLAGYISIGIGSLHFLLTIIESLEPRSVFYLIINIIFGFTLLLTNYKIQADRKKWAVLAFLFSLVLISLGGTVGILAGLIGVLGGVLAFLSSVDESFDI